MTNDDPRPRRRLRGWRLLLAWSIGFALLVALVLGIGVPIWLRSTADLGRVDARARALGIAPTWAEAGLTRSAPERIALQEEFERLQPALRSWRPPSTVRSALTPGVPPLPAMINHHAALDRTKLERLLAICDELGPEPVIRRVELDLGADLPEITPGNDVAKLLAQRIALAHIELVPAELGRICELADRTGSRLVLLHLVRAAILQQAARAVIQRLDDLRHLRAPVRDALCERLRQQADRISAATAEAFVGEFRCLRATLSDLDAVGGMQPGLLGRILVRGGRERLLGELLRAADAADVDASARVAALRRFDREIAELKGSMRGLPRPGLALTGMLMPGALRCGATSERCALLLRLAAAELAGSAWPVDAFDPSGAPLRRIERDGRLIGAYSVGSDGHDDGGDAKRDDRFALYAPLDPVASAMDAAEP